MSSDYYNGDTSAELSRNPRPLEGQEAETRHMRSAQLKGAMVTIERAMADLNLFAPEQLKVTGLGKTELTQRYFEADHDIERKTPAMAMATRDQAGKTASTYSNQVDQTTPQQPTVSAQDAMLANAREVAAAIYDAEATGKIPPRIDEELALAINFPATGSTVVELRPKPTTELPAEPQIIPFAPLTPIAQGDQHIAA